MKSLLADFAPMLARMSIVSISIGITLLVSGFILKKYLIKQGKKTIASWICIVVGFLLILNHGLQLIFYWRNFI